MEDRERDWKGSRSRDSRERENREKENRKEVNRGKSSRKKGSRQKEQTGWKAALKDWLEIIGAAVVIAFVLNTFIIANSEIPTPSMENTIMAGSRVMGSRLSYKFSDPERGDIAIFLFGWRCPVCRETIEGERQDICPVCGSQVNKKGKTVRYVKRVIGIPGDTVDIVDGKIYLNGSDTPLEEDYLPEAMAPHTPHHFEVPEESYLMLGDNRNNSGDARFWRNPYISEEKIRAKVLFEYFPEIKRLD